LNALATFVLAASEGGGSFLVSPNLGLMIWTLIAFGISMLLLRKYAFPPISDALEKRSRAIQDSIDHAEQTRKEADKLLEEYRARLKEAREQAEDILVRSRKAAERSTRSARRSRTSRSSPPRRSPGSRWTATTRSA
jgi:F-type H+-transporting ATPase subunit b